MVVGGPSPDPLFSLIDGLGWRVAGVAVDDSLDVATALRPDLVIVNGGESGPELVSELLGHHRLEWVPIVVADGASHPAEAWLDSGARDVLHLSMPTAELEARLAALMRNRAEVVALVRRNRELDELAGIDVLTDLPNRRRLDERLRALESTATRRAEPLGIVLVDIDHFKAVNDTHGHQAGDEVLRQLAARFRRALRADDAVGRWSDPTLGRWAGDEFIVGFAGADRDAVEVVAERLRTLIASEPFLVGDSGPLEVTISVGGAVAVGEPWPELFRRADLALYHVKQTARNATRIVTDAEPTPSEPTSHPDGDRATEPQE